ncbi:MAG: hypothetical protein FWE06_08005 [Oscillospiraceae bacterium]|nr:hypothetical protein [Oscillospiraceae bacterium]
MMWKSFWEDLNIRKCMVLVILGLYGYAMHTTGQDLGVRDMLLMALSYYFGYSNGHKQKRG